MNEAGRLAGGPPDPVLTVAALCDVLSRVIAGREELAYDSEQAATILADLEQDLARLIADAERPAA